MKRNFAIRRLLAILVIAGLALVPLSRPVMAAPSDASMQALADVQVIVDDMSSSATTDEMANDMPCCPPKAPAPVGCDKCVLMTACTSKCFTGILAAVFHPLLAASDDIALLKNDSGPDGLGYPPPDHPPRTQV